MTRCNPNPASRKGNYITLGEIIGATEWNCKRSHKVIFGSGGAGEPHAHPGPAKIYELKARELARSNGMSKRCDLARFQGCRGLGRAALQPLFRRQ